MEHRGITGDLHQLGSTIRSHGGSLEEWLVGITISRLEALFQVGELLS